MSNIHFIGLTVASFMFAACQADSYKITGKCDILTEGDTIFLTNNLTNLFPIDTAVISDGRFSFMGKIDSSCLGMIYSQKHSELNIPFFVESGTISIYLSDKLNGSSVSGTKTNEEWQSLNNRTSDIGIDINQIACRLYHAGCSEDERRQLMHTIEEKKAQFGAIIEEYASNNINNKFGIFLLTYYTDIMNPHFQLEFIDRLPEETRNSPDIVELYKRLTKKTE